MVNTRTAPADTLAIAKIVNRASKSPACPAGLERFDLLLDLSACHVNGCPLDLAGLLAATDFDFWHDLLGIGRTIDRTTGKLGGCFLPRYAAKVGGVA